MTNKSMADTLSDEGAAYPVILVLSNNTPFTLVLPGVAEIAPYKECDVKFPNKDKLVRVEGDLTNLERIRGLTNAYQLSVKPVAAQQPESPIESVGDATAGDTPAADTQAANTQVGNGLGADTTAGDTPAADTQTADTTAAPTASKKGKK